MGLATMIAMTTHLAIRRKSLLVVALMLLAGLSPPFAHAQQATPASTPAADNAGVLLDVPLDRLPTPPATIGMAQMLFPTGSTILGGSVTGPRLFLVQTGTFSVWLDSPGTIWRERDRDRAESADQGAVVQLEEDDLLIVLERPPFELTNISTDPATLIDIIVWPSIEQQIRPFVTDIGVIFEPLVAGSVQILPDVPARIIVQRLSLSTDRAVGFNLESGPQLIYVESGILGVLAGQGGVQFSSAASNAPGSIVSRLKPLRPGSEARLTAGGSTVSQMGATGTFRNLGRTRLDLLELRVVADWDNY